MASFLTPDELLVRDHEQADRLVLGVGHQRTQQVLARAQHELTQRLARAEGLGGPGKDSFTAAQLRATLAQVRAVTAHTQASLHGVVTEQGKAAAELAANNAVTYLQRSERFFKGSTERLNIDGARIVDRAVAGSNASVLRRLMEGPDPKKKQGILQRYGENVVGNFEDILQQKLIQRTPWHEVRQQLTDASPFLQGAPGSWAERIVRTETMAASGNASLGAIQEAAPQLGDACKILSSVFDSRTGADSIAVHGQIRRPDEPFDSWFGSFMAPPDRPNDRGIVVPHRISWPIPGQLKARSMGAVAARWSAEGRKGSPPPQPLISTIPLELFGKQAPPSVQPESPDAAPQPPQFARPVDRRVSAQVPDTLRAQWPAEPPELFEPPPVPFSPISRMISGATGSNPGGIYEGTDQVKRYVKFYKDPAQAYGEHLANSIYSDLGLGGVNSMTFEHEGKVAYASELKPDTKTLGSVLTPKLAKKALEGFAADVLMANWDAAGLKLDNMMVGKDGSITRIDNGAAFLTRAQGARKPIDALTSPTEWSSFFDPNKNPAYAKLAAKAGVSGPVDLATSIQKSVKAIVKVRDAAGGWDKYVEARAPKMAPSDKRQIIEMLDTRTNFLEVTSSNIAKLAKAKKAEAKAKKNAPPGASGAPITAADVKQGKAEYKRKLDQATPFLRSHPHLTDLRIYTGSSYTSINRSLAGLNSGPSADEALARAARINRLLADAKAAGHAVEGVVLRGFKGSEATVKSFMEKDEHTLLGFTSTTSTETVARNFAGSSHPVFLRIRQKSAIPIDRVSQCSGEDEALLPSGTRIRIISRTHETRDGRNWLNIDAEEI